MTRIDAVAVFLELRPQGAAAINANVPPGAIRVLVGKRPANSFWAEARDRRCEDTVRLEDALDFGEGIVVLVQVLENLRCNDTVEGIVRKRQPVTIGADHHPRTCSLRPRMPRKRVSLRPSPATTMRRIGDLFLAEVDSNCRHPAQQPSRPQVTPIAAAEIEHPTAGPETQAVDIYGLHDPSRRAAMAS